MFVIVYLCLICTWIKDLIKREKKPQDTAVILSWGTTVVFILLRFRNLPLIKMSVRPLKVSRARLADANELAMEKEKADKVSKDRRKKRRKSRKTGRYGHKLVLNHNPTLTWFHVWVIDLFNLLITITILNSAKICFKLCDVRQKNVFISVLGLCRDRCSSNLLNLKSYSWPYMRRWSCTDQQSDSTSLATGVATSEMSGITDQQLDVTDGAGAGSSNFATPNEGSPQAAHNLSTTVNRTWSSKSSLNSDATTSPRADDLLPTGVATASPPASRKEEGLPGVAINAFFPVHCFAHLYTRERLLGVTSLAQQGCVICKKVSWVKMCWCAYPGFSSRQKSGSLRYG